MGGERISSGSNVRVLASFERLTTEENFLLFIVVQTQAPPKHACVVHVVCLRGEGG